MIRLQRILASGIPRLSAGNWRCRASMRLNDDSVTELCSAIDCMGQSRANELHFVSMIECRYPHILFPCLHSFGKQNPPNDPQKHPDITQNLMDWSLARDQSSLWKVHQNLFITFLDILWTDRWTARRVKKTTSLAEVTKLVRTFVENKLFSRNAKKGSSRFFFK